MAYNSKNLSVLAYSNGFTLWHYCTEDTMNEVIQTNYFAKAKEILRRNDHIHLNTRDSSALAVVTAIKHEVSTSGVLLRDIKMQEET